MRARVRIATGPPYLFLTKLMMLEKSEVPPASSEVAPDPLDLSPLAQLRTTNFASLGSLTSPITITNQGPNVVRPENAGKGCLSRRPRSNVRGPKPGDNPEFDTSSERAGGRVVNIEAQAAPDCHGMQQLQRFETQGKSSGLAAC